MTGLELRHLQLLMELRARAHARGRDYDERLEDFVLEMRESGCSARGMAEALGVSASTVQAWTKNARLRGQLGGG